ncbi:hypothetical protein M5689_015338 [Euphorbia peplus]|nr:hypothetical protein M5689_015338 [Euphorbia peplus]
MEASTVQHVTKKSSDELLRKFAELGEDEAGADKKAIVRVAKRRKRRSGAEDQDQVRVSECYKVERRSLLLPPVTRKSVILRQLGIGRSQLRARDIKNKSILVAIEKTWRKTLEGASRVLLDKRYNRHKRLISDVV